MCLISQQGLQASSLHASALAALDHRHWLPRCICADPGLPGVGTALRWSHCRSEDALLHPLWRMDLLGVTVKGKTWGGGVLAGLEKEDERLGMQWGHSIPHLGLTHHSASLCPLPSPLGREGGPALVTTLPGFLQLEVRCWVSVPG